MRKPGTIRLPQEAQPGPHRAHLTAVLEREPRPDQAVLQRILGRVRRQDPAAVGKQLRAVAPNQGFEGRLVALLGKGHQTSVALGGEDGCQRDWRHIPSPLPDVSASTNQACAHLEQLSRGREFTP